MQGGNGRRTVTLAHALLEQFTEQAMIAIPLACGVERYQKKIGAFEVSEFDVNVFGVCWFAQCRTQRGAHPLQDRGSQQEGAHSFGLMLQNFFKQIIGNMAIATGERTKKRVGVTALQRDRGHLQANDPALRAVLEHGDLIRR